jgi:tetratricopeptide (TPR) repeat protein
MALQDSLSRESQTKDLQIRIGIHLGDVVDKGGDLFGTAVNVAARLEGIAQPGGIVVSAAVRDAIAGKLPTSFADLGVQTLKNIEEPLRAYALSSRTGSLAVALNMAGTALVYVVGDFDHGAALIEQSLALNSNLATAWQQSGWMSIYRGDPEGALERFFRAMRLSPRDLYVFDMLIGTGCAHFLAGRYAEALSWAEAAVRQQPNSCPALRTLAACSAMTGRQEQAQKAMVHLRALDPGLRISNLRDLFPVQRKEDSARWEEALRLAGLPE